jgi:aquaporin Z
MLAKKCLAEFIGTFLLCYVGCGAAILNSRAPVAGPLIFVCLIVGLGSGFGHISGAHFNPSVSLAFLLTKQIKLKEFCAYITSQCLGALSGFFLLYQLLSSIQEKVTDLACNVYGELSPSKISAFNAFCFEFLITCFFVYVILTNCKKAEAPFIIGFTIGPIAFLGGSLTGGSMNPARSLAPALIMGGAALRQVWLFLVAPMLGAAQSVLLYNMFNCECKKTEKKDKAEELVELDNKA